MSGSLWEVNEYSRQWFEVFLESMPEDWTHDEVAGVCERVPVREFPRVLDICCGPARHAKHLAAAGYQITGIDLDEEAIRQAKETVPDGNFVVLDQRCLTELTGPFDAAVVMWQSFGYFDTAQNDEILADIAALLRPGGRLLLDLFHPGYFEKRQGRTTSTRDPRCAAVTNRFDGQRLTSTIEYADGATESMNWELFTPDVIGTRAKAVGLVEVERCCWWDSHRPPDPDEQRFQVVFERAGA